MEDTTLFRTAKEPETEAKPEKPREPSEEISTSEVKEVKPSEYPVIRKYPYLKEVLEIDSDAYNTFDVKPLSEEIDEFIRSEVERQKLKDTSESYKSVLDNLLKTIGLPEDINLYDKLDKIVRLVRIHKKLLDATREKEELLNSDPTKLSSSKLKELIKETGGNYAK